MLIFKNNFIVFRQYYILLYVDMSKKKVINSPEIKAVETAKQNIRIGLKKIITKMDDNYIIIMFDFKF